MNFVSVIIPAYNYADYIEETLRSVADQLHQELECIVIDDGSTDGTRDVVEAFCKQDSRFRYYYQNNQGLSAARNTGLTIAAGDFIAFLDADDLWANSKLSNQIQVFTDQDCDVVYSNSSEFSNDGSVYKKDREPQELSPFDFIGENPITGSASSIIFKREICEKIGLFDVNLRSLEDLDYWFRTAMEGFRFKMSYSIDVKIRLHPSSMSKNHLKMFHWHVIVLEKQIDLIRKSGMLSYVKMSKSSILDRLGIIRWYSNELNRFDLSLTVHLLGINLLGIKYLGKLSCINICTDYFYFLKGIFFFNKDRIKTL